MNVSAMNRMIKMKNQLMLAIRGGESESEIKVRALEEERSQLLRNMEKLKSVSRTVNRLEMELIEAVAKKAELEGKIKALTNERESLLKTIEELKGQIEVKDLEVMTQKLETEVKGLRGEEKGLREKLEKIVLPEIPTGSG